MDEKQFEYATFEENGNISRSVLDAMSNDRWELVSVIHNSGYSVAYFKREIKKNEK